jgi:hypothetical protein
MSAPRDVIEADLTIEQGADQQRCPFLHPTPVASLLEMLHDGFMAHPEDAADLPVAFSPRNPDEAFALARRHRWRVRTCNLPGKATEGFQGEDSCKLGRTEHFACPPITLPYDEGAGPAGFSWHPCRHSEPCAKAMPARVREDFAIAARQRDEAGKVVPGKSVRGVATGTVDRVVSSHFVAVEIVDPFPGVVVQADGRGVGHRPMVTDQGVARKSEPIRKFGERVAEVDRGARRRCTSYKHLQGIMATQHERFDTEAASQVTDFPRAVLPLVLPLTRRFSRLLPPASGWLVHSNQPTTTKNHLFAWYSIREGWSADRAAPVCWFLRRAA